MLKENTIYVTLTNKRGKTMGAWGTSLFADDYTCDIRDDYGDYLKVGLSDEVAMNMIIDEYKDD